MRPALLVLAAAAACCCAADARAGTGIHELTLRGHGLGHGIGLSQLGAEARAAAGESAPEILRFYYPGTALARAPSQTVRILVAARPRVTISVGGVRRVFTAGRLDAPLFVGAQGGVLRVGGTPYAGTLRIAATGGTVQVVDEVPLEEYVAGVVSAECPGYWPAAALRAQAIASRSYALASLRPAAAFDLYADDRSQNFRGLLRRLPAAVAAAAATRGRVLEYRGAIVPALFSASNGGRTSVPDGVWGGEAVPWLVSRPDPYDRGNADSSWGPVRLGLAAVRAAFPQVPADVASVSVERNAGRRAVTLTFHGADGTAATVSAYAFQQRLGLRSTYFTVAPD